MYSLMQSHTPEEVNMYVLDFASETLRAFDKSPHVGEVLLSYEVEKINNLFKMLYSEIERRKKLFALSLKIIIKNIDRLMTNHNLRI